MNKETQRLDNIAVEIIFYGHSEKIGCLSVGEATYVALAADRPDLFPRRYSIVEALDRIGVEWMSALVTQAQYRDAQLDAKSAAMPDYVIPPNPTPD